MSINFICNCKSTFSLSTPACPRCGSVPTKVKVRLRSPTGWRSLVTTDMNAARAFEEQLKQASKQRRERSKGRGLRAELGANSTPTLSEVFDLYIEEVSDSKQSYRSDMSRWSLYLEKPLGPLALDSITPQLVLKVLNGMKPASKFKSRSTPLSQATHRQAFQLVRHLFRWAKRRMLYLGNCPTDYLDPVKVSNQRQRYFSGEEIEAIKRSIRQEEGPLIGLAFRFLLYTGRRKGEVLRLEPKDIDPHQATATFRETKSGKVQVVPLSKEALRVARKGISLGGKRVFNFKSSFQFDYLWRRVTKRAGLTDCCPHTLRHTFASTLVSRGIPLFTVAGLLGHSTVQTSQRYSHLSPDTLRKAVSVVDEALDSSLTFHAPGIGTLDESDIEPPGPDDEF